jgi:hypothetical protein
MPNFRISDITGLQAALDSKAPLASPALTGTPTSPTAPLDATTTQLATTAFVVGQAGDSLPLMDGAATAGTSKKYSREDHRHPTDTSRAPVSNPTFTGTVTGPNFAGKLNGVTYTVSALAPASPITNDIWVDTANQLIKRYNGTSWGTLGGGGSGGAVTSVAGKTGDVTLTSADVGLGNVTNESKATMLTNSTLTGTPTATTAAADTTSTQLATTAFVIGQAGTSNPNMDGIAAVGTSKRYSRSDHVHPTDTSRAPVNNPTFTGTVTGPNFIGKVNGTNWLVASSVPSSPSMNDIWVDTTNLLMKRWNGTSWNTIGNSGVNGSTWFNSTGVPVSTTGVNGDYNLNTVNGDVYKKTTGVWSVIGNILGATGPTGATGTTGTAGINGSTWFNGSGTPSSSTGVNGDFYLNTLNGDVYRNESSAWNIVGNIKGPQGTPGSGGGGSAVVSKQQLQVVGKKNQASFGSQTTYSGSKRGQTYCQKVIFACDCYDVQFLFVNPLNVLGAGSANLFNLKVSLELISGGNSTFYPLTSKGERTFSVSPDESVYTDEFPMSFKKNDVVYLRIFVSSPSNKWVTGALLSVGAGEGVLDGDYTNFPTTATDRYNNSVYSTNGAGTTTTGTPTHQNSWVEPGMSGFYASDATGYATALCVGKPSPTATVYPVVATIGDSISRGSIADFSLTWGIGYGFMQMAVDNVDGAWIDLGQNGQSASGFVGVNSFDRSMFLGFCTHALVEYGVNDISLVSASDARITQITTDLQNIYNTCKAHGIGKVYACTPVVRTNSSDSWATLANQTAYNNGFVPRSSGGNNTWQDLVSWQKGNSVTPGSGGSVIPAPVNLDGYFDTASAVTTLKTGNIPVWKVGMVSQDGLGVHPNQAGHVAMAALIPSSSLTVASSGGSGGSGDMLKSVYDTNNNGVVDKAEKLNIARTITLTGSVTGSAAFDGSANIVINTSGAGGAGSSVYVNVKSFGAIGNNVADDTQAFKNALASLTTLNGAGYDGGVLFVPKGTYKITQQLTLQNVILKGETEQASIIRVPIPLGANVPVIKISGNRGFLTGLEDISLQCEVGAKTPYGSKNHNCDGVYTNVYCFMNRVSISNFDVGLNIDGASHCRFSNCHIQGNYYNVYFKHDEGDNLFDMCILDGASFACIAISGDYEGHPLTRWISCHVGAAPFGIYQEAPVIAPNNQSAMMVEWYLDGLRFEGIGNAAIYSEGWNNGNGKGLVGCTIRNVGFNFMPDGNPATLAGYPKTYAVWVGYCSWTNIYEPGLSGFYHATNPGGVGGIFIKNNNADWIGTFKFSDFAIGGGVERFYSTIPLPFNATDLKVSPTMICDPVEVGGKTVRRIIIALNGFSNGTGPAVTMTFPVPFAVAPQIKFNGTGIANTGIVATTTGLSITTGNNTSRNGFIELVGY